MSQSPQTIRQIPHPLLSDYIHRVLRAAGVREDVVQSVVGGLLHASLRGVDSHGVRLLPHYLRALKAGRINPNPNYQFRQTSPSTALLDADHTYGMASGMEAVRHAIRMAREVGTGQVAVHHSTHFGAASYFALEIASQDMIGTAYTNTDALLKTHGGSRAFLGNNPIAFAVPMEGEEPLCLDMATSQITFNRVLKYREDNEQTPPGTGADASGQETTDPHRITSLIPTGTYKGYGLSLMVEILCSMLTGMPYGRNISSMYKAPIHEKRFLAHFVTATRVDCFQKVGDFKKRMAMLAHDLRAEPRFDPEVPIQIAGDPEKRRQAGRSTHGIPLSEDLLKALVEAGQPYHVTPGWNS